MKQVGNPLKLYTHKATGLTYRYFQQTPDNAIPSYGTRFGSGFYMSVHGYVYGLWRRIGGYKKSGMVKGFTETGDV